MMADMSGMFGPSPYEIEQQRNAQAQKYAYDFANMNATQRGSMGLYQAGSMFGDLGAKALGGVNPAVQNAQMTHEAAKQFDTSTPEGLMQYAAKIKEYDPARATQAVMMARKMTAEAASAARLAAKDDLAERRFQEAEKVKIANDAQAKADALAARIQSDKDKLESGNYNKEQDRALRAQIAAGQNQLGIMNTELRRMGIEAKTGGLAGKPKGLTREAGLKWELDNGWIDQPTYDASISASPGGVLRQKQTDAISTSESGFNSVERNIEQLYDPKSKALKPAAQSLFGQYAQYRPETTMSQETVDAKLALEGLTDQVMMANLADAKARVGQSFGSMQVQEWDKFTQQLTSLKRGLSEAQAAKSMEYVLDFIKNKRAVLNKALNTENSINSDRTTVTPQQVPPTNSFGGVSSPEMIQVKQLFQSGKLSREQAKAILAGMESRGVK